MSQNNQGEKDLDIYGEAILDDEKPTHQINNGSERAETLDDDGSSASLEYTDRSAAQISPAHVLKPTGAQIQKALKYFDLGMKLELILFELHQNVYFISITELTAWTLGIIFFFMMITKMGPVFLLLPHFLRGILGIAVIRRLPRSHHIIKYIDFTGPSDNESLNKRMNFNSFHSSIKLELQRQFVEIYADLKIYFQGYLALSCIGALFDSIAFCIVLGRYGTPGDENAEMVLFMIVVVMMVCNFAWTRLVWSARAQLPDYIAKPI